MARDRSNRQPEEHDPVPVGSTIFVRPPTIQEMIHKYVREVISSQAVEDGDESFEDADDFEIEDEDGEELPITHHQVVAMTEQELRGIAASYGIDLVDDQADPGQVPQEGASPKAVSKTRPANAAGGAVVPSAEAPQEDL